MLALLVPGYWLFIDRIVQSTVEETGTTVLGTAVEVRGLDIHTLRASMNVGAVHIADPFDRVKDLVSADDITLSLDPEALSEKQVVIRHMQVLDLRVETPRRNPAPAVSRSGFAPRALAAIGKRVDQYRKPILSFTRVDTIRAIALDPTKLDQEKQALEAQLEQLTGLGGLLGT